MFEDVTNIEGEDVLAPGHHVQVFASFSWDDEADEA
ncbi:hypothetical protein SUDANB95_04820 [Actinosynnema sp. ALI-1.44]